MNNEVFEQCLTIVTTIDSRPSALKKDEVSPNFLSGKIWGNGHISHNFPKGKWKSPFPLNFPEQSISLKFSSKNYGEILVFLVCWSQEYGLTEKATIVSNCSRWHKK